MMTYQGGSWEGADFTAEITVSWKLTLLYSQEVSSPARPLCRVCVPRAPSSEGVRHRLHPLWELNSAGYFLCVCRGAGRSGPRPVHSLWRFYAWLSVMCVTHGTTPAETPEGCLYLGGLLGKIPSLAAIPFDACGTPLGRDPPPSTPCRRCAQSLSGLFSKAPSGATTKAPPRDT